MRWKALEFLRKLNINNNTETYSFQSIRCPPEVEEISNFENDVLLMAKNIEFRKVNNSFQERLINDIKQTKNSDKVLLSIDKSRHAYSLGQKEYKKLLKENITKTYKKSDRRKVNNMNSHAKRITEKLPISGRIEKLHETEAYITIKDHKEDFPNKISCRLINPSKSSIGKISKGILDKINQQIQLNTNVNQWKDTPSVIKWFNSFENKERLSFMIIDNESFYPSISENLFIKAIQFARQITEITHEDINLIMQARKVLLFNEDIPWVKKEGKEDFVPMGCSDGLRQWRRGM